MSQNVVVCLFEVESEAFQSITELKQYAGNDKSILTQAMLVRKENGKLNVLDGFNAGTDTWDDTAKGGLIGALIGILGGPIGVLFGAWAGALIGASADTSDAMDNMSITERIAQKLDDDELAIIALTSEEDESILDAELSRFKTIIVRFDAAVVAVEVEKAEEVEKEMERLARQEIRDEKKAARKQKVDEKRAKLSANFEAFKEKHKKEGKEETAE